MRCADIDEYVSLRLQKRGKVQKVVGLYNLSNTTGRVTEGG